MAMVEVLLAAVFARALLSEGLTPAHAGGLVLLAGVILAVTVRATARATARGKRRDPRDRAP